MKLICVVFYLAYKIACENSNFQGRNGLVEKLTTGELSDIPVMMSNFDLKYRQGKTFNFDKVKYKYLREDHVSFSI